ncbi:protein stum homolog isoform X1 [Ammospiza nelsoni]|uniref:protein stum homolog isoform X1 n=1 Tax=Ammospiza nelsoni TaxID=2857394 RepID=UPI00286CB5D8|nr:protein stum homolog isoform X1 [Ammospiza nelsoni]
MEPSPKDGESAAAAEPGRGGAAPSSGVVVQVREKKGPLRAAIPYMPFPVAVICLFLNTFVPGLGTAGRDGRTHGGMEAGAPAPSFASGRGRALRSPQGCQRANRVSLGGSRAGAAAWPRSAGHGRSRFPGQIGHIARAPRAVRRDSAARALTNRDCGQRSKAHGDRIARQLEMSFRSPPCRVF